MFEENLDLKFDFDTDILNSVIGVYHRNALGKWVGISLDAVIVEDCLPPLLIVKVCSKGTVSVLSVLNLFLSIITLCRQLSDFRTSRLEQRKFFPLF